MLHDLDTLWAVQQCLAQYMKYTGRPAGDWDILDVSFQSLSDGPDRAIVRMQGLFDQGSLLGDPPEGASFRPAADQAYVGEFFRRPA